MTMRCYCSPAHQNLTSTVGAVMGGSPTPAGATAVVLPHPRFAAWAELHVHHPGSRNDPTPKSRQGRRSEKQLGSPGTGVGKVVGSL